MQEHHTYLVFYASVTLETRFACLLGDAAEHTSRISTDGRFGVRVKEVDQEEGNVLLPRYTAISTEIDVRHDIPVSVRPVRYQKLAGVDRVMDIPAAAEVSQATSIVNSPCLLTK